MTRIHLAFHEYSYAIGNLVRILIIAAIACVIVISEAEAYTSELQALRQAQAQLKTAHQAQEAAKAALKAYVSQLTARGGDGVAWVPSAQDEQTLLDLRRGVDAATKEVQRKFAALQAAARAFQVAFAPYKSLVDRAYAAIDVIRANGNADPENRKIAIRAILRGLDRLNFVSTDAPLQMLGGLLDADLPAPQDDGAKRAADAYAQLKDIVGKADSVQSAIAGVQEYLQGSLSEAERRAAIKFLRRFIEKAVGASNVTGAITPENAAVLDDLLTQLRAATDVGTINSILSRLDQIQAVYDLFRSRSNEIFRVAELERLRAFVKLVSELAALDPTAGAVVKYYIDTMDAFIAVISEKVAEIRALKSDANLLKLTELGSTASPWPHEVWRNRLRAPSNLFFRQAAPDDLIRVDKADFEPGSAISVGYRKAWFYEAGEATLVLVRQDVTGPDSLSEALAEFPIAPSPLEGKGTLQLPDQEGRYELRIYISHRGRQEVTVRRTIRVGAGPMGYWANDRGDIIHLAPDPTATMDRPDAARTSSDAEYISLDLRYRAVLTRLGGAARAEGYSAGEVLAQVTEISSTHLNPGFLYFRYPRAVEAKCGLGMWELPLSVYHDPNNKPERLSFYWQHTQFATDDCRKTDAYLRSMSFRPVDYPEAQATE